MKSKYWQIMTLLAAGSIAAATTPVFAALGGDVASVQADQLHMKAGMRIQTGQAYTVQELHEDSGTVVKEFISPAGKVFAISWSGPFIPDLHQLLGTHFDEFSQAAQTRVRRGRAPLMIHTGNLVVQSAGHMRGFFGKAYLTDSLPEGVTANDVR